MKNKAFTLMVCLMALLATRLHAQSKSDCPNAKTQRDIDNCEQHQYTEADKELNAIYHKVISRLSAADKATVVQAQRKWINFRDEDAKVYARLYKGGSMAHSIILSYKTQVTRNRTTELKSLNTELQH